jgi:hypothetical protein
MFVSFIFLLFINAVSIMTIALVTMINEYGTAGEMRIDRGN